MSVLSKVKALKEIFLANLLVKVSKLYAQGQHTKKEFKQTVGFCRLDLVMKV